MRALFVAPYLPTPGSGGRTRLEAFVRRLGTRHRIAVAAFIAGDQSEDDLAFPGVALTPPPLPDRPTGMRGASRFYRERLQAMPVFASYVRDPMMTAAVADLVESFRPDVVQFETTEMGQYLAAVPKGTPRVLDLQDVSSRWVGRAAGRTETTKQRALLWLEVLKTRRFESRVAGMADAVCVTSPIERDALRSLAGVEAVEVPNGVDVDTFTPMGIEQDPDTLAFVGPLTSAANMQAMRWFAGEVLPLILSARPGVRVEVVGTQAGEGWPEAFRFVGRVEDVRPHVARAPVSIVPIRVGSGTRYKILEALSMERAVVSTTVGAEGLHVRDGEHLLIADEPEAFARAVLRALNDPALRGRLGSAGRAHVRARFDWDGIVTGLEAVWDRVVGQASDP